MGGLTPLCSFSCPSALQGGEYGTDEEEDEDEEVSPPYPSAIEVFDLAENEDLSPLETDPEKLAHKYKEVRKERDSQPQRDGFLFNHRSFPLRCSTLTLGCKMVFSLCDVAPDKARCDPG